MSRTAHTSRILHVVSFDGQEPTDGPLYYDVMTHVLINDHTGRVERACEAGETSAGCTLMELRYGPTSREPRKGDSLFFRDDRGVDIAIGPHTGNGPMATLFCDTCDVVYCDGLDECPTCWRIGCREKSKGTVCSVRLPESMRVVLEALASERGCTTHALATRMLCEAVVGSGKYLTASGDGTVLYPEFRGES